MQPRLVGRRVVSVQMNRSAGYDAIYLLVVSVVIGVLAFAAIKFNIVDATSAAAIASVVLAVVTVLYVAFTLGLLRESYRSRIALIGSYIIATIEVEGRDLYFVVRNIGRGPAANVRVHATPPWLTSTEGA